MQPLSRWRRVAESRHTHFCVIVILLVTHVRGHIRCPGCMRRFVLIC